MGVRSLQIVASILFGLIVVLLVVPIPVYRSRPALCEVCDSGYCPECPDAGWYWEKSLGVLGWSVLRDHFGERMGTEEVVFVDPTVGDYPVPTSTPTPELEEDVVDENWEQPELDRGSFEVGI